jgi:hypothetical protein
MHPLQRPPIARWNERSPVVGVVVGGGLEEVELDLAEGVVGAGLAFEQAGVVLDHEVLGTGVIDFPEADQLAAGAGEGEGAAQAVDAFAVGDVASSTSPSWTGSCPVSHFRWHATSLLFLTVAVLLRCFTQRINR